VHRYLQIEWDEKKAAELGPRSFDKPTMKGATPACPQQCNSSDCGVFVLQYIESFFLVEHLVAFGVMVIVILTRLGVLETWVLLSRPSFRSLNV